jgi:acetoin utilization protein AcuB
MRVSEWMTRTIISVTPTDSLQEAEALMYRHRLRHLLVMQCGRLIGLLSDQDLLSAWPSPATMLSVQEVRFYWARLPVSAIMTRQMATVTPQTPIVEASRVMQRRQLAVLPVLEADRVVGVLRATDCIELLGVLLQQNEMRPQARW